MKSYLSGSPELHLALNDNLVIAGMGKGGYGMVRRHSEPMVSTR